MCDDQLRHRSEHLDPRSGHRTPSGKTGRGVIVFDEEGRLVFANRAAEVILGSSARAGRLDQLLRDCTGVLGTADAEGLNSGGFSLADALRVSYLQKETHADLWQSIAILEEEKAQAEAIIAAIGDGITLIDSANRIIYQNQASKESVGERIGRSCYQVFADRNLPCDDCYMTSCFADGRIQTVEKSYTVQGRELHLEITVSPLRDAEGKVIAGIKVARDISERKQSEERLQFIISHDTLTGLYNRSYFEQELMKLEGGRSFPVSIVMADVDDLKVINDRLGHAAGDALLMHAAGLLRDSFRNEDIVARIGGDEFAVLLPNTGESAVLEVVARIREHLQAWNESHSSKINLSIGTAVAHDGAGLLEAQKTADRRMYEDKIVRTGRPPPPERLTRSAPVTSGRR